MRFDCNAYLVGATKITTYFIFTKGLMMRELIKKEHNYTVAKIEAFPDERPSIIHRTECVGSQFVQELSEDVDIVLVPIPSGTFMMGAADDDPYGSSSERPQHLVGVKEFLMMRDNVTQKQWRWVAENLPKIDIDLKPDPSYFKGDDLPVESISWEESMEFAARLSAYTGLEYSLPSEAQWEYACLAGETTPFHFGNTIESTVANFDGTHTFGNGKSGPFLKKTTPVGHYGVANNWGLRDMHGNVWEWCLDRWHPNYEGAPFTCRAWTEE